MGRNLLKPSDSKPKSSIPPDLEIDSSFDLDEEDLVELDRQLSSQKSNKYFNSAPASQNLSQSRGDQINHNLDISFDEDFFELLDKPHYDNNSTVSLSLPLISQDEPVKIQRASHSQSSTPYRSTKKGFHVPNPTIKQLPVYSSYSLPLVEDDHITRSSRSYSYNNSFSKHNSEVKSSMPKNPKTELDLIAELSDDNDFDINLEKLSIPKNNYGKLSNFATANVQIKREPPVLHKTEFPKESMHLPPRAFPQKRTLTQTSMNEPCQNQDSLTKRPVTTFKQGEGSNLSYKSNGLPEGCQSQGKQTERTLWTPSFFRSQFLTPFLPKKDVRLRPKSGFPNLKTELWSQALAPKETDDVVVHKNKVAEVRYWLTGTLSKNKRSKSRILVLNGAPGTGKSSLLRVLANELQIDIVEWITPETTVRLNEDGDFRPSIGDRFQRFIQSGMRYKALGAKGGCRGQLVMLDDLPSIEHFETRRRIQATLRAACNDPSVRFPVVLVASSLGSATDPDSDRAAESNHRFSAWGLVPPELFEQGFASRINFNPVAVSFLRKALVRAVELRFDVRLHPKSQLFPIIAEIAEGAEGDLRCAINELQLRCAGRVYQELSLSEQATASEAPLNLFHALGKVFFCKWVDEVMQSNPEAFLASCPVELTQFCEYLFQNYPPFMSTIDQCLTAADAFSYASALEVPWGRDPHPQSTALMRSMILTRGILNAIKANPCSNGRPRFFRPATRSFSRQMAGHRETIALATQRRNQARGMSRTSSSLMITEFLPYLSLMKKTSPGIEAAVKFTKPSIMNVGELKNGDDITADELF